MLHPELRDLYIVVLTPVFLFAVMHLASYSLTLLDVSKQIIMLYYAIIMLYTIMLYVHKRLDLICTVIIRM